MINENWVFLAVAVNLAGAIIYAYSVVRGTTRPNRVTWFILSLAPLLAFGAMMLKGVSFKESLFTLETGISPLIILISTYFSKLPKWEITRFDLTCGALSLLGLAVWLTSKEGDLGIAFAIAADGLAFLPTLVKSFRYPETESPYAFVMGMIAALIALAIITKWDFTHVAFPLYILIADTLAVLFIYFKVGKKIISSSSRRHLQE